MFNRSEATGRRSASTSEFANPPLLYTGDESGGSFWPDSPRIAQRTTELPTRLPGDLETYTPDFLESPDDPDVWIATESTGPQLSPYKNGFFQKLSLSTAWLPRGGHTEDYGLIEVELFATVALPAPTRNCPLLITPYLQLRNLDGPRHPDLPAMLYEAYLDFMWVPKVTDRLTGILAIAPAAYGDFQQHDADTFRWTGKGLVRFDLEPGRWQLLAGALYLGRDDIKILPAGGLTWTPNEWTRYEMIFPRPKLAHRFRYSDSDRWEDWAYIGGEFGGNSFAILRDTGLHDKVTLRDWRAFVGVERKRDGGAGLRLEIGYIFARTIEYASGTPSASPNDTLLIRLVGTF